MGWKWKERDKKQQQEVLDHEQRIRLLDKSQNRVVIDPDHADCQEAHRVSRV
jgi:hypothetical protein